TMKECRWIGAIFVYTAGIILTLCIRSQCQNDSVGAVMPKTNYPVPIDGNYNASPSDSVQRISIKHQIDQINATKNPIKKRQLSGALFEILLKDNPEHAKAVAKEFPIHHALGQTTLYRVWGKLNSVAAIN